jgi:hypothetical protein
MHWMTKGLFEFLPETINFLFSEMSRLVLGPTNPSVQSILWPPFVGLNLPGCEVNHCLPYSAEVKNAWSYTSCPLYTLMHA